MCGPINEKVNCGESVKMTMALHYTRIYTLWNAVSAGDMVMDGFILFLETFSQ